MVRFYASLIAALLFATPALAQQETLERILSKGAKRLSAPEVKSTLSSNVLEGPYVNGEILTVYYNADGSLGGINHTDGATFQGSWSVDDRGVQCLEYWIAGWGSENICRLWFGYGDALYVLESVSDADKSQPVYERKRTPR